MKSYLIILCAYLCSTANATLITEPRMPIAVAVSHQWVSAISPSGATTLSQPAFTDVSGSVAASQMPALTGDVTTSAGAVATTLATVNTNTGSFGDSSHVASFTVNGKGLITAASSVSIPVKATGEVFMTAVTSCPGGSIAADGSSLLRSGGTSCGGGSCATLFAAISTTYGTVDGTHFTLPNMSGVFARGAGTQTISAISYSGTQGTSQGDQIQGHKHGLTDPGHTHAAVSGSFGEVNNTVAGVGASGNQGNFNSSANTASATTGATVSTPTTDGTNGTPRTGTETRPANIVLLYCIVY